MWGARLEQWAHVGLNTKHCTHLCRLSSTVCYLRVYQEEDLTFMARWLVGLAPKLLHDLMARWLVDIWLDDYMSGYLAMCLDMVIGL